MYNTPPPPSELEVCPECRFEKRNGHSFECSENKPTPPPSVLLGVDNGKLGYDKTAKVYGHEQADGTLLIDRIETSEPPTTAAPIEEKENWEKTWDEIIWQQTVDILSDYQAGSAGKFDLVREQLKSFIRSTRSEAQQEERSKLKKEIQERIELSDILIESANKGDDLEDGWQPQERIDHEESAKAVLEELLLSPIFTQRDK